MDPEKDGPTEGVEVTDAPQIRPLAVDFQSPGLATLVPGSFQSTARAGRTRCLFPLQVHDRVKAIFLDVFNLIPCNSDFF